MTSTGETPVDLRARRPPAGVLLAAAALLIVVASLALSSVRLDSATMDEPAHIGGGMVKVLTGRLDYFRDNPPLWNAISAAPLVITGHRVGHVDPNHWVEGRILLFRSGYDSNRMLLLARLPTIAVFLVLCVAVFWFVTGETGSGWWGLTAMALTGFCPNLIAHGRLATTDVAATCAMFVASILLLRLIERPAIGIGIALGVVAASAIFIKTSALFLGPYFVAVVVLAFVMKKVREPRRFFVAIGAGVIASIVVAEGIVLGMASQTYLHESFPHLPRIFVPFAESLANLQSIRAWLVRGHQMPQFLLGRFSYSSWPHYYLVAMLLKMTIPALLVIVAGVVGALRRPRFHVLACLLFALGFLVVASSSALAVGVRYVLPAFPFLYSAAIIALSTEAKRMTHIAIAVLLVWHAAENVAAYPGYIAYFNEVAGGKAGGDRFLIDSNLDWGQDLRRLDQWCDANGVKAISIHYFGGGDVERDLPGKNVDIRLSPGPEPLPPGWFAVSRHFYRLSFSPIWPVDYETFLAANGGRYVTTVGDSIRVYRVR